jgi:hypothetical protein
MSKGHAYRSLFKFSWTQLQFPGSSTQTQILIDKYLRVMRLNLHSQSKVGHFGIFLLIKQFHADTNPKLM